jgi:putative DNA primase/helicase
MKYSSESITFSLFKNAKDNSPRTNSGNWDSLKKMFEHHSVRPVKDGAAWSPATYPKGATRSNRNVGSLQLAVLDIDNGFSIEAMLEKLKGLGLCAYCHSSYSHTIETHKYRVILLLSRNVSATDWALVWGGINTMMGGISDQATKDPARLYYLPSRPHDSTGHFFHVADGHAVDVDQLISDAKQPILIDTEKKFPLESCQSKAGTGTENEGSNGFDVRQSAQPEQGLAEVAKRCAFIPYFSSPEHQNSISEPLWMAGITNTCVFENSDDFIHRASEHHDEYDEHDTQARIERYRESFTPTTCERIRKLGFEGCPSGGCKTPSGKVTAAPAGLGSWAGKIVSIPVVTSAATAEGTPEATSVGRQIYDKEHGMSANARIFAENKFDDKLAFSQEQFRGYKDGYWPALETRVDIDKPLAKFIGKSATPSSINGLREMLKTLYCLPQDSFSLHSNLICVNNGTLDPLSGSLHEHNPGDGLKNKLDIDWDESATCPVWLQTLDEIFGQDPDAASKMQLLQEYFGLCLVPLTTFHKFLWFLGGGGNGKSLVIDVLVHLLGRENISFLDIERIEDKFARAELHGKLVNISSEMSAKATVADGHLKQLVGGDIIEAERKNQNPFSFKPYARIIAATNELPQLKDSSDGFFRRAIILKFNRKFSEHEQDRNRITKLIAEMPGILAWAVTGLRRLMDRQYFEIPPSSTELTNRYRIESDSVMLFAEECLETSDDKDDFPTPTELYQKYSIWCHESGHRNKWAEVKFKKRLEGLGFEQYRSGGRRQWKLRYTVPDIAPFTATSYQAGASAAALAAKYIV